MCMNCLHQDPKKHLSKARLLLPLGLLILSCGILWPRTFAPFLHLPVGMNDPIQGFCIGLGITLEIGSVALVCRIRSHARTS